ncbi:MAG: hypothetical protein BIFFINMI_03448 [Phycisphaerae bacterium]|nr:hypothetical protein [Phycisphaerae bacterium]
MKGDLLVAAINWVLGLWYVAWILSSAWGWRRERSKRGPASPGPWPRRMIVIGLIAGAVALPLGLLLWATRLSRHHSNELVLAGLVYLLTGLLLAIRRRQDAGRPGGRAA